MGNGEIPELRERQVYHRDLVAAHALDAVIRGQSLPSGSSASAATEVSVDTPMMTCTRKAVPLPASRLHSGRAFKPGHQVTPSKTMRLAQASTPPRPHRPTVSLAITSRGLGISIPSAKDKLVPSPRGKLSPMTEGKLSPEADKHADHAEHPGSQHESFPTTSSVG